MTNQDRIVALIRTLVPALYGVGLSWLISRIPAVGDVFAWLTDTLGTDATAAVSGLLVALVVAGYYAAARALSAKFPILERWLLGSSLVPVYATTTTLIVGEDTGIVSDDQGINE